MFVLDPDERRRKIAEAALDVIAREGLDAATIRRIAAELGCSTTVITHYFADKQELLLWAYRALAQQAHDWIDEVAVRDPTDLAGCLLAMSAADEASERRWRVYVAFWDRAARDSQFAEAQRLHMDIALKRIANFVRARIGDRDDVTSISLLLNALVHGISVQALIDRRRWTLDQIRATLAREVEIALHGSLPVDQEKYATKHA